MYIIKNYYNHYKLLVKRLDFFLNLLLTKATFDKKYSKNSKIVKYCLHYKWTVFNMNIC